MMISDNGHPSVGGTSITAWNCKLCFIRGGQSGTTRTPKLCDICSNVTNRCKECGKLLEK